jgi:Raf kinase inhibitor-like YbhB/YbcL family protein
MNNTGRDLRTAVCTLIMLIALCACQGQQPEPEPLLGPGVAMDLQSSAFEAGGMIPTKYTCDGQDVSPALSWSEPPVDTESLVLFCDDPDAPAGTWDHWVLFNIPAASRSLPESIATEPVIDKAGVQGANSWGKIGYGGPCPPKGGEHRYYFRLYALDTNLDLEPGATRKDVEEALQGHVLAQGQLMGRYGR